MSKRLTLTLTDEEHADLEARADSERRSVRDMAAYLVTRHPFTFTQIQPVPIGPAPFNPIWPPNVWCGTTDAATDLNTYTTWNSQNICGASGSLYPPLRLPTAGHQA